MNNPIAVAGLADRTEVSLIPEAHKQKAAAIAASAQIVIVTDEPSAQRASDAERELKRIAGEVEKSRQAIKKPVLDLGRDIDEKARAFVAGLESEARRLNQLRLTYANKIEEANRFAEREREEAQRVEREAVATKEREAVEAARRAEELKGKAAKQARAEADRLQWEAEKAAIQAEQNAQEAQLPAVQSVVGKLKVQWDYEVLDAAAFVSAYPQFCKIEVKRREFLEALNGDFFTKSKFPEEIPLTEAMPPKPPGIRVFASKKIK